MLRLAKTLWRYTEYSPCRRLQYNPESPREEYHDDDAFMKMYAKAPPVMQCMMDLAQMNGFRRGMILRPKFGNIDEQRGIRFALHRRKRGTWPKYRWAPWTDELREVIARSLALRRKARGGQNKIEDTDTAPLFPNRRGKAITSTGFNTMRQRVCRAAGFGKHTFHFHDIKAKSLSDSPDLNNAMERGDHTDPQITKRVYRRKPAVVTPLPRVSKKPA